MPISRFEALARRLVLVLGLGTGGVAACDVNQPLPSDPSPSSAGPPSTPVEAAPEYPTPAAAPPPAPPPRPPAPAATMDSLATLEADVEAELAHLRSLKIAEVRGLMLNLPDRATGCDGPCSPKVWDDLVSYETQAQLPRLRALRKAADDTIANTYPAPIDLRYVEGDLGFLNSLEIVELGDLLRTQPANNPNCYNTPCAADVQKAELETATHAFYLHAWAGFASREKP